jgi:hypothetical protein
VTRSSSTHVLPATTFHSSLVTLLLPVPRFLQLLLVLAAFAAGLWFFYAGYEREVSLAGKTETGLTYLKTGVDGRTRILTYHQRYGVGLILIIGSTWWLLKGGAASKRRRR